MFNTIAVIPKGPRGRSESILGLPMNESNESINYHEFIDQLDEEEKDICSEQDFRELVRILPNGEAQNPAVLHALLLWKNDINRMDV